MPTHGLSLDGDWRLAADPGNVGRGQKWWRGPAAGARPGRVPGIIREVFPGYHGVAWHWTEFQAPPNPNPGGRCLLRFGAVESAAGPTAPDRWGRDRSFWWGIWRECRRRRRTGAGCWRGWSAAV